MARKVEKAKPRAARPKPAAKAARPVVKKAARAAPVTKKAAPAKAKGLVKAPAGALPDAPLFPEEHPQAEEVSDAIIRVRAAENLVDLYDAWLRLRLARGSAAAERSREAERLDVRAEYVLRSVENARTVGIVSDGAATPTLPLAADPFEEFELAAHQELSAARGDLQERARREEDFFEAELGALIALLKSRAAAMLQLQRPRLQAQVQPVGRDRSLVHVTRPGDDEAVLLYFVLAGKLFTRYDAFFDDSVDDLSLPPARFYAEEGLTRSRFASVEEEDEIATDPARLFVPLKGMIAFKVPGHDFPRFRIVNQGPLAEVEARLAGGSYEHLMPREAAELLSGYLIRLQVEKKLIVSLKVG